MKKKILLGFILMSIILVATFFVTATIDNAVSKTATSDSAKKDAPKTDKSDDSPTEEKPSTAGRVIAFFVVGAVFVVVVVIETKEKKKNDGSIDWKMVWRQPAFYTILGVGIFHSMTSLFVWPLWRWTWDHQVLFWGVSLGLVIMVHFLARGGGAKWVAKIVGVLMLAGLCVTIATDVMQDEAEYAGTIKHEKPIKLRASLNKEKEAVMEVIADCESGDKGEPGTGAQFYEDGKPVRNPEDAPAGTGAVGKWQINLGDKWIKKLVQDHRWDVEGSEADNRSAAYYLSDEYGVRPWTASKNCWGPKLDAMARGGSRRRVVPTFSAIASKEAVTAPLNMIKGAFEKRASSGLDAAIEVPAGTWSKPIVVPADRQASIDKPMLAKLSVVWNSPEDVKAAFPKSAKYYKEVRMDFPLEPGKVAALPNAVCCFRVMSRDKLPIPIKVKIF